MIRNKIGIVLLILVCLFNTNMIFAKGYSYLNSQNDEFQDIFRKSYELYKENKYEEAIESYKKAYDINPKHMMVISELCRCYYKLKNSSELEKYAKKGLLIAQKNIVSKYFIGIFYSYLGDSYGLAGKYDLAVKYLELSIINNPYSKDPYNSIWYCLGQIRKYKEAIEYAKRIELLDAKFFQEYKINESIKVLERQELENNPVSYHLNLALNYLNEKKLKEQKEELEKVLKIEPENVEALMGLASQEFAKIDSNDKEKNQELIKSFEKIIILLDREENESFLFLYSTLYKALSLLYENIGNTKMSKEYDIAFKNIELFFEAEKTYYNRRDTEKAFKYYKKAVDDFKTEIIPYNYNMIEKYILQLGRQRKYDESKEYTLKAINRAKKDKRTDKLTEYKSFVGEYYYSIKQYENAIKYYNLGLEEETKLKNKYYYNYKIAKSFVELKNKDEAFKAFDKCIKFVNEGAKDTFDVVSEKIKCGEILDKNSNYNKATILYEKGVNLFKTKKYKEAIECFSDSLQILPQNLDSIAYLSQCLFNLREYEKSFEVAKEGLTLSSFEHNFKYDDTFCSNLSNYYSEIEKNKNEALFYALLGYERKPINKMRYNASNIYIDLKQYEKAIEILSKSNPHEPLYAECLDQLAYCYEMLEKYENAVEYYEKAYELNPTEEISSAISRCKSKL